MTLRLRDILAADLRASNGRRGFRGGVAAYVFDPGFAAVFRHRLAKAVYGRGYRRLGMLLWRRNVTKTGCFIHLNAEIGPGFVLPHPVGVVVGVGSRVGLGVTLYQGVTLGRDARHDKYPVIGDHVVMFPNAVVTGDIRVGDRAVIGAGTIVRHSVEDGQTAVGNPARILLPRQG
jgi:serine O-acetyltransferase